MTSVIRPATIQDFDQILSLNKRLFSYETRYSNTYNQDWTFSEKGQSYFKKQIETGVVLVAEIKSNIVGYLCGYLDNFSCRSLNPIFEIENMFVATDYQQRGIGTKLISELEKILKKKNVKIIKVGTLYKNNNAQDFYTKQKFAPSEVFFEKQI